MNAGAPRLPYLPAAGYEPPHAEASPAAVAAAADEARKDQEVFAQTFALASNGVGAPGTPREVPVYKTKAPWCAIDVFITPNPPPTGFSSAGVISVYVYAVTKAGKVLVTTGRYFVGAGTSVMPFAARWVAAGRTSAQAYEVTVQFTQFGGAPFVVGAVDVSIVATNEAVDAPWYIGAENGAQAYGAGIGLTGIGVNLAGIQFPNAPELIAVRASNGVAAARWLHLYDTTLAIVANGTVPLMVWPIGAAIGAGFPDTRVRYRAQNRVQLVASSTQLSLTLQIDCAIGAFIR